MAEDNWAQGVCGPSKVASVRQGVRTEGRGGEAVSRWTRSLNHPATLSVLVVLIGALSHVRVSLHRANADTLLGPLMSTRKLTFYYWDQDRLANVVPALASVIRSIEPNLHLQVTLFAAGTGGVFALFLALNARALGIRSPLLVPVGTALAVTSTHLWLEPHALHIFTLEQAYALTYLFLIGGILLLRFTPPRAAVGSVLIVTAIVMNPSAVLLAPVARATYLSAGDRNAAARTFLISGIGFGVAQVASRLFGSNPNSTYYELDLERSVSNWNVVAQNITDTLVSTPIRVIVVTAVVLIVAARPRARWWWVLSLSGGATALAWMFIFGGVLWVEMNLLYFRYFYPVYLVLMFLIAAGLASASALVESRINLPALSRRSHYVAVVAGLGIAVALWLQLPRIEQIDSVVAVAGPIESMKENESRYVVGSYWDVWPTVIALADEGYEAYGIANRGDVLGEELNAQLTADLANGANVPVMCINVPADECNERLSEMSGISTELSTVAVEPGLIFITQS